MTEYKTFDDYVRNVFKIEPREITHISPEEQKKKTFKITADELINIWNELTELKSDNDARKFAMAMSEKVEKKLRQENTELQEKYDTCLRENTGLKIHSAYVEKKFTKVKEIIKKLKALYFSPVVTKDDVKRQDEILEEAKQFLSDIKEG